MATVAADVISPELALVCPELRQRALRQLPELPWQSLGHVRVRPLAAVAAQPTLSRQLAVGVVHLLVLAVVTLLGAGAVTLVLTLVADATRPV